MMGAKCKITIFCVIAWLIPVLTSLFIFMPTGKTLCTENLFSDISIASYSMIPYFTTVVSTLLMYQAYHRDKFRKQGRENKMEIYTIPLDRNPTTTAMNPQLERQHRNIHNNLVKLITLIFIGYSITCLPYFMNVVLYAVLPLKNGIGSTFRIIGPLQFCNAFVTITVYTVMDADFRKYLKMIYLLYCGRKR